MLLPSLPAPPAVPGARSVAELTALNFRDSVRLSGTIGQKKCPAADEAGPRTAARVAGEAARRLQRAVREHPKCAESLDR